MRRRRKTFRSEQPCPVCGGRDWYPLTPRPDGGLDYDPHVEWCGIPIIDEPGHGWHDECAKCGTVIV